MKHEYKRMLTREPYYPAYLPKPCKVCSKTYSHRQSLSRHMDQIHQVDSKTHPILVWWKRITWRGYERNH